MKALLIYKTHIALFEVGQLVWSVDIFNYRMISYQVLRGALGANRFTSILDGLSNLSLRGFINHHLPFSLIVCESKIGNNKKIWDFLSCFAFPHNVTGVLTGPSHSLTLPYLTFPSLVFPTITGVSCMVPFINIHYKYSERSHRCSAHTQNFLLTSRFHTSIE